MKKAVGPKRVRRPFSLRVLARRGGVECPPPPQGETQDTAMASISTLEPRGSAATCTVARAGGAPVK
jgi:hypothetical protein